MNKAKSREQIAADTQAFLAAGGKVKKCPTREAVKRYPRSFYGEPETTVVVETVVNTAVLPAALRAKFGIK